VSRGRTRAAALALAVAACHHAVHRPGAEWLREIRFEGNRAFGASQLRTGLALHRAAAQGAAVDPYLVDADAERVRGFYVRGGYIDAVVRPRIDHHGDATVVTFVVVEGERAKAQVEIIGVADPELRAKVRASVAVRDGAPFDYAAYDAAKQRVVQVAEDAGYAHAQLDAHVIADRAAGRAIAEYALTLGPRCTFGDIAIRGVSGELADAVRARVAFARGSQYSLAALTETRRRLYEMQRFASVRVLPDKTDGDVVPVTVAVAIGARNEVALGGGLAIDPAAYEARARIGYSIAGWPFAMDTVAIDLRPAYAQLKDGSGYEPRVRASAKLTRLDLFHPYLTGEVEVGYDYLVLEAWTQLGPRARLGVATPIGSRHVQLRIGWQLVQASFAHLDPLIDPATAHAIGLDRSERVGAYQQSLVVDLRDHPLAPHSGMYAALSLDEGTRFALGSLEYIQVTPELRGYVAIGDEVIAARARYGAIAGDIPVIARYYSGGATTQRGFSERRMSPTLSGDVNGTFHAVPIGGGGLFETGVELRAHLATIRKLPIGGVVFLDGGDVTPTASQLDFAHLNWAAGTGVRVVTPVGPVRLDVGYRLNRTGPSDPEPRSHYAFHLSIGEAF
jgi:outer membrane protein assembly factor BamA